MSTEAVDNEKQHGLIWKEIRSIQSAVYGNGSKGHEQRISELETRAQPENCIGAKIMEAYRIEIEKKKSFSVQTILLWITAIGIITQVFISFYGA